MERILVCGTNWLGDSIMSMPALQVLKATGTGHVTLLTKPALVALWERHPAIDDLVVLEPGRAGAQRTVARLRTDRYERALVFPNSFRSAWLAWRGGAAIRRGAAGHWRRFLLNDIVDTRPVGARRHQAWEYARIANLPPQERLPAPVWPVSAPRSESRRGGVLGLLPGAARGPAKRWPPERFAAVGRRWLGDGGEAVHIFGTAAEHDLGEAVRQAIGSAARNEAGRTDIPQLAAALAACRVVVCNDSGGMHLAAAVGVPVAAVFGLTDPERTGPLGEGHALILAATDRPRGRDIARSAAAAEAALRSVTAERVMEAVRRIVERHA